MIETTDFTDVDHGSLLSKLLRNCIVATNKLLGKVEKKTTTFNEPSYNSFTHCRLIISRH